jgi:hypothetical protein
MYIPSTAADCCEDVAAVRGGSDKPLKRLARNLHTALPQGLTDKHRLGISTK